jgi:ring-1,2-phenylacetyl-CoA epoxidase subunit PaaC
MNKDQLYQYILHIADNTLILGQRLAEWCGHGPVLEEDIALSNIALDYFGQCTNLLKYAAEVEGWGRDEDQIAFLRDAGEYKNALMVELPNGDYGKTIARQFLFSSWYKLFLEQLVQSSDAFLKGFAEKSLKEVKYHLQHSSDWMLRLGDGTDESHQRVQTAVNELWEYTGELFEMTELDQTAVSSGIGVDMASIESGWRAQVEALLREATLSIPEYGYMQKGGKKGKHTEHLGFILSDMQYLQRTYPGARW